MLPPPMRHRPPSLLLAIALTAVLVLVAGCGGEEHETEVVEGEPIEIEGLEYNVALTRFLNPNDNQDSEYLVGQPEPTGGSNYLGVFLTIENEGEEVLDSATDFEVHDTDENRFEPLESESAYALEIGAPVPGEGQLPLEDTTAQAGPIQGAMLLFRLPDEAIENRPLELEIDTGLEEGAVQLDI